MCAARFCSKALPFSFTSGHILKPLLLKTWAIATASLTDLLITLLWFPLSLKWQKLTNGAFSVLLYVVFMPHWACPSFSSQTTIDHRSSRSGPQLPVLTRTCHGANDSYGWQVDPSSPAAEWSSTLHATIKENIYRLLFIIVTVIRNLTVSQNPQF